MRRVRVIAPAKVNWTLEVLHARSDGYHEIRSVMQTIDLCDSLTLSQCENIELKLKGDADLLAGEPPEINLAYRAAEALRAHAGVGAGVRIELTKEVPIAAGLGGGSSDAAAVLRGCDQLWDLKLEAPALAEIAGSLGSDVPFFLAGGTAFVAGRGEQVEPLRDAMASPMLLAMPRPSERAEKTASMYAALSPREFSDGESAVALRETIAAGRPIVDGQLVNVFERVLGVMQRQSELAIDALRAQGLTPHLAGSGPSFFVLLKPGEDVMRLEQRCRDLRFETMRTNVLNRAESLSIETV